MNPLNNTVRKIIASGELSQEFYEESNIWHAFTQTTFHNPLLNKKSLCERRGIALNFMHQGGAERFARIREYELGGYNWNLVNMEFSQEDKIAACAYLFSQCLVIAGYGRYHEGFRPRPCELSDEERKARWLKEIKESAEKDRIAEEERQAKIKSGEIVLPEPGRPFEAWFKNEEGNYFRWKTARSAEALMKSVEYAGLLYYRIYHCKGPDETSRVLTMEVV